VKCELSLEARNVGKRLARVSNGDDVIERSVGEEWDFLDSADGEGHR
jgi:hypothetical protein